MYTKQTRITNETGLHARPASNFVLAAKGYQSAITVKNLDREDAVAVNGKSLVRLLAAGLSQGTLIEIAAAGEDEETAVDALTALVESGFGE